MAKKLNLNLGMITFGKVSIIDRSLPFHHLLILPNIQEAARKCTEDYLSDFQSWLASSDHPHPFFTTKT